MITWIGPVILMTAAIVPAEPKRMLVAALLAASMDPLGMLIGRAAGVYRFDSVLDTLAMHYPNYLLVGVAVVISGVVTRLGQQAAEPASSGVTAWASCSAAAAWARSIWRTTACSPARRPSS